MINRYYDPATDQFLSVDPAVATTNQPYVFTNDDPLNAEDSNGLVKVQLSGGSGPIPKSEAVSFSKDIVNKLKSDGVSVSGDAAQAIAKAIEADTAKPGSVISSSELAKIAKDIGVVSKDYSVAIGVLGSAATAVDDVTSGHNVVYAIGDAAVQWSAAGAGFDAGATLCAESVIADPACGFVGAVVTSGAAAWMYHHLL
jgi:hypothetical protein